MRETSLEAYYDIRDSGLLSKRRFQVYEIICLDGPLTIAETIQIFKKRNLITNTGSVSGRFSELQRLEVITEFKTGPCPITGRQAIFWTTSNKLPIKREKKETNKEKIKRLELKIKELEQVIERINCDF